jgi:U3 small nucleolar RNA-associated protein 20
MKLLLCFVETYAVSGSGDDATITEDIDEEFEEEAMSKFDKNHHSAVRNLVFKRIADLISLFSDSQDFSLFADRLWTALASSLKKLPNTVVSSAGAAPSLLLLLETISRDKNSIELLRNNAVNVVETAIECICIESSPRSLDVTLKFIENLLIVGADENDAAVVAPGLSLVTPHVKPLVEKFVELIKSGVAVGGNVSTKQLSILCLICTEIIQPAFNDISKKSKAKKNPFDSEMMTTIISMLLPFLQPTNSSNKDNGSNNGNDFNKLNIIQILVSFTPLISADDMLSNIHPISKLLGPNKSKIGISDPAIRMGIVSVISCMGKRMDSLKMGDGFRKMCCDVEDLSAMSPKHVEELDFDRIVPVLNKLGGTKGWVDYNCADGDVGNKSLLPILMCCFNNLYSTDGVVTRGSLKALRAFVGVCASKKAKNDPEANDWLKILETSFIPSLRLGINGHNDTVRVRFVLLMREVCVKINDENPDFYSDLRSLTNDDDEELDFFYNITHVQQHRRVRALQRLRKVLEGDGELSLSMPSLFNVLLPLSTHPIFECVKNSETAYVQECVTCIGAICKNITWGKYKSVIDNIILQIGRNKDKKETETVLISALCSILDAFHFDVSDAVEEASGDAAMEVDEGAAKSDGEKIWKALNKLVPKIEAHMSIESKDKGGSTIHTLRPQIALALLKLFQKFPQEIFERRLAGLVITICTALRSKDSKGRDIARTVLTKMSVSLGPEHFGGIVHQLSMSLGEGYQLHIRSATLHACVLGLSENESVMATIHDNEHMDGCVAAIMDLIQQDIFGTASEMKEVQDANKRVIKEAMGVKSYDTLELMCGMVRFKPSETNGTTKLSAVHGVVGPLIERLKQEGAEPDMSAIGKVKECLNKAVIGFGKNASAEGEEILKFVYATVAGFIGGGAGAEKRKRDEDGESSEDDGNVDSDDDNGSDEEMAPVKITGEKKSKKAKESEMKKDKKKLKGPDTWLPSESEIHNQRSAVLMKREQKKIGAKVLDGASAPKLTGRGRHGAGEMAKARGLNNPAVSCAVTFGLQLLHAALKKGKIDWNDDLMKAMATPYVPMLTRCVRRSQSDEVVLLSVKCLNFLLKWDLGDETVNESKRNLGSSCLRILTKGGIGGAKDEIVQSCFKALTFLFQGGAISMNQKQMRALVNLLHGIVHDTAHHNSTFGLIGSIVGKVHVNVEVYELMDTVLKLVAQSTKDTVRQKSGQVFYKFLINYPLGDKQFDNYVGQIIKNLNYEYEDGRFSVMELVYGLLDRLPEDVLDERYADKFFLPLVLALANDTSDKCREKIGNCLKVLFRRIKEGRIAGFYSMLKQWLAQTGKLKNVSLQTLGLLCESRVGWGGSGAEVYRIIEESVAAEEVLEKVDEEAEDVNEKAKKRWSEEWEAVYYALVCFEKLYNRVSDNKAKESKDAKKKLEECFGRVITCLTHYHPWVKLVAGRIVGAAARNSSLVAGPDMRFEVVSKFCGSLDVDEKFTNDEISLAGIKSLTAIINGVVEEGPTEANTRLLNWMFNRLSGIAKKAAGGKRMNVFKLYASLLAGGEESDNDMLDSYIELILTPLNRAISEGENVKNASEEDLGFMKELLNMVEVRFGTDKFMSAYAKVKQVATERKEERRSEVVTEKILDPVSAALRKEKKRQMDGDRKKRRVQERKDARGAGKRQKR